ncbi:MAG: hypothetical protein WD768_21615 [Phycisphaeraceae bacterium]
MNSSRPFSAMMCLAALSLVSILFITGCGKGDDDHDHGPDGHVHNDEGHHHAPPRGGIMVELGEHEFQVEFKIQHELNVFTMWIMDGHAEKSVRIAAPQVEMVIAMARYDAAQAFGGEVKEPFNITLLPAANATTGEKVGDTSQFNAPLKDLQDMTQFNATITSLTIRGKEYKDVKLSYDDAKVKK